MGNSKVSIIVPVYKVEKKVGRCIQSIQKQTFSDWKLILVNDASPDGSWEICQRYASADNRIVAIDKKQNEGVDKARFTGLKYVDTEYVTFVDSDDHLAPSALEKLLNTASEDGADVTEMGMLRSFDRWQLFSRKSLPPRRCITQPELMDKYYVSFFGCNRLGVNMCGKLYRTELIRKADLRPTGYTMGEDLFFNLHLFPYIKRYSQVDYAGYIYNWGGLTSHYNTALYKDLKEQFFIKVGLLKEYSYTKGEDYVRIEMKNILKSHIQQLLQYRVWDRHKILSFVATECHSQAITPTGRSFHEEVTDIPQKKIDRDPFYRAFQERDAETCVWLVEANLRVPKNRLRRMALRTISLFDRLFSLG